MTGQLVGGSMGALLGSQMGNGNGKIIATALGAVAGLAIGGALGRKFDQEDKRRAEQAAQKAACTGQSVEWRNESTKSCGTWYPGPVQQYGPENRSCRWLECLATDPDGQPQKLVVYAEQQPDGSWVMASPPDGTRPGPAPYAGRSSYPKSPKNLRYGHRYGNQYSAQPYQGQDGQWYQPQQVPYQAADGRWYVDAPMR